MFSLYFRCLTIFVCNRRLDTYIREEKRLHAADIKYLWKGLDVKRYHKKRMYDVREELRLLAFRGEKTENGWTFNQYGWGETN